MTTNRYLAGKKSAVAGNELNLHFANFSPQKKLTCDQVNGCLTVGIPELVEVVPRGRVDPVLHEAGQVPLSRSGEVSLEGVGAGVLPAQGVAIVGPQGLEHSPGLVDQRLFRSRHSQLGQLVLQDQAAQRRLDHVRPVQAVDAVDPGTRLSTFFNI